MSSNLREFTLSIRDFAEREVPARVVAVHKRLALEAIRGVVYMTNVKSGRLRGNWQMTHDAPAEGYNSALDFKGDGDAAARYALGKARPVIDSVKFGEVTWLHNGVPYAIYIEKGTPRFKGTFMVETTVTRLQSFASRL